MYGLSLCMHSQVRMQESGSRKGYKDIALK